MGTGVNKVATRYDKLLHGKFEVTRSNISRRRGKKPLTSIGGLFGLFEVYN